MGVIPKMHIYTYSVYIPTLYILRMYSVYILTLYILRMYSVYILTLYILRMYSIYTYSVYILTLYVLLQVLLPEGLANEAEKLLSVLLCPYDMSVTIKLQFIQACINNIENNK